MKFYPITFSPILKDRIWGGTKLKSYLHKNSDSQTTGESWEISTVPGDISVVNSGLLKGKNINEIIELYPEEILGKSVIAKFGKQFPLLFKFIDAKELTQDLMAGKGQLSSWSIISEHVFSNFKALGFFNSLQKLARLFYGPIHLKDCCSQNTFCISGTI